MRAGVIYQWIHAGVDHEVRQALLFASLATVCAVVVTAGRVSRRGGIAAARRMDRVWGGVLIGVWLAVTLTNLLPGTIEWGSALPLHVCHVVALAAAVAMLGRGRFPRAVVYFWGLGLSSQAFMQGTELGGLTHLKTYVGWGYHEANVAAALYELFVRRYRPTWRDWRLNVYAVFGYAALVLPIDVWLNVDYGMLGPHVLYPTVATFGAWPGRVVWLMLTVIVGSGVMTLAWPRNRPLRAARRPAALPRAASDNGPDAVVGVAVSTTRLGSRRTRVL